MLFSLKDLLIKVNEGQWGGAINFYPSDRHLTKKTIAEHQDWLEKNLSLNFGDKVIVITTVTPETIITLLWLWSRGVVVVPVKHNMSAQAISVIASDCHAVASIENQTIEYLEPIEILFTKFREHATRQVCGSDLALIIYTSGSTGQPKGIMLSHNNVVTAMYSIGSYLRINNDEHILGLSPLSFDYGLYQILFSFAFDCQCTLFEEPFHPLKVLKAIDVTKTTLLPVVPAMATSLSKVLKVFRKPLPHLKKITNTGGHLGENVIDELIEILPQLNVFAMYGLTECKRALYLPPEDIKHKRGSVGIAIPGLEAKLFELVDADNQEFYQELKPGEVGELFVRGAAVMQGYYGNAGAGANLISGSYRDDNWLATGDLFIQDQCGYFYFKGRRKELIKQAGFCIYPTEAEALIEKQALVNLAAIIPAEDRYGDEIACLCIQLHHNNEENQKTFQQWLTETMESDYRPRTVKFIDNMALTPNGKVDKKYLVESI